MHLTSQIKGYNNYKMLPSLENEALESNSVRSINSQGPLDLVVTAAPGSTCETHCHGGKRVSVRPNSSGNMINHISEILSVNTGLSKSKSKRKSTLESSFPNSWLKICKCAHIKMKDLRAPVRFLKTLGLLCLQVTEINFSNSSAD